MGSINDKGYVCVSAAAARNDRISHAERISLNNITPPPIEVHIGPRSPIIKLSQATARVRARTKNTEGTVCSRGIAISQRLTE